MSNVRINWNKFNDLEFNEKYHSYNLRGKKLISCTQFLSKFKPNIFTDEFVQKYADKHSLNVDYVKGLWDIKAKVGTTKGSEIHFFIESLIKHNIRNEVSALSTEEVVQVDSFMKDWKHEPVKLEYKIYDEDSGIAGTLDCLAKGDDNKYYLYDWKSNEDLEKPSFGNKFLSPIERLDLTSLNTYTLQLSLYSYILEKNLGIDIEECYVVHFNKNLENYKIYNLPYKKMSIQRMIISSK
jgi:ATP-dependent exoDNAse (exonuclease V) beta subunit